MMKILSYGALITQNSILKKQINELETMAELLKQESLQTKVIEQLKQLSRSGNATYTKPNLKYFCHHGHFHCKIHHVRYNKINLNYAHGDVDCTCPLEKVLDKLELS